MIFQRSVIRELTTVAFAVFSVLLAILLTTQIIRLFDQAAAGNLATDAIFAMIAFTALASFGTLLSITVFIAVLVVLTRMYRDHEMAVWMTAGLSPVRLIRPVLGFAVPLALLVMVVSLLLAPWAQRKGNEYADILQQREEVSALAPGVFKEAKNAERVYFVENFSGENGSANNIFVQSVENGQIVTIFAKQGFLQTTSEGERYLVLEHGYRYDGRAGQADFKTMEFSRYKVKIAQNIRTNEHRESKSRDTLILWQNDTPSDRAELAWRLSMPISAVILALLAVPLATYNPRAGQGFNLLIAVFVYQLYWQGMNLVQSQIAQGEYGSAFSILPLHFGMLALFMLGMFIRAGGLIRFRHFKFFRAS